MRDAHSHHFIFHQSDYQAGVVAGISIIDLEQGLIIMWRAHGVRFFALITWRPDEEYKFLFIFMTFNNYKI
jgi:hypothetical protein